MEICKDLATIEELRPRSVNNESSLLWASLRQCMTNNEELRQALVHAAETITKQTDIIEQLHEALDAGKSFKYY